MHAGVPAGPSARLGLKVELDRQGIERRDFPISRRGYAPAAVDAHLQALAGAVEELQRALAGRGADSLAASAGTQVQAIVAAAEVAAEEIESEAKADAQRTRAEAQSDAQRTRADAIAQAQAHVAAVGSATATLLTRVESLDGETGALLESMRAGATKLAGELAAVETNMGELYDAAAGRAAAPGAALTPPAPGAALATGTGAGGETMSAVAKEARAPGTPAPERPPEIPPEPVAEAPAEPVGAAAEPELAMPTPASSGPGSPSSSSTSTTPSPTSTTPLLPASPLSAAAATSLPEPESPRSLPVPAPAAEQPAENGDLDGARLVALNMALNGDSREEADRYLAEHYEVPDRARLLDEVYAAIEG